LARFQLLDPFAELPVLLLEIAAIRRAR